MNNVVTYLVENWKTFEQMKQVEAKIDERLAEMANSVKVALETHKQFPKSWQVVIRSKYEGAEYVQAWPQDWDTPDRLHPAGHVEFGSFSADEMLASLRDDRTWSALVLNFDRRKKYPQLQKWCQELRLKCDGSTLLAKGFEYNGDASEDSAVLTKNLDEPVKQGVLESVDQLSKLVVDLMMPAILYAEKLRASYRKAPR